MATIQDSNKSWCIKHGRADGYKTCHKLCSLIKIPEWNSVSNRRQEHSTSVFQELDHKFRAWWDASNEPFALRDSRKITSLVRARVGRVSTLASRTSCQGRQPSHAPDINRDWLVSPSIPTQTWAVAKRTRTKVNWIRLCTPGKVNKSVCAPKGSWWHHNPATFSG